MAIALGGVLGASALGAFELAAIPVHGTFTPHRGHARSAVASDSPRSSLSRRRTANSAITAHSPKSEVS